MREVDIQGSCVKTAKACGIMLIGIGIIFILVGIIACCTIDGCMVAGVVTALSAIIWIGLGIMLQTLSRIADVMLMFRSLLQSKYEFERELQEYFTEFANEQGKGGSQSDQFQTGDLVTVDGINQVMRIKGIDVIKGKYLCCDANNRSKFIGYFSLEELKKY